MQLSCQMTPSRPNSMYGNGAQWPPQPAEPVESLCKACNISRYTFEPPSIFCTSCQQRIKRNQVRLSSLKLLWCTDSAPAFSDCPARVLSLPGLSL